MDTNTHSLHFILSTRIFNVPRPRLFRAWSDPSQLQRWWGPNGFTNTFNEFNFTPGGTWEFVMHGPDGANYNNESRFISIKEDEEIIFDHISNPKFQVVATFKDEAGGTRLTFQMLFDSEEVFNYVKPVAVDANEQNFDRLEVVLAGAE
jgi:uncharacterized protein YndB with AHSA1/START domain